MLDQNFEIRADEDNSDERTHVEEILCEGKFSFHLGAFE